MFQRGMRRRAMGALAVVVLVPLQAHAVVVQSYSRCAVLHMSTVQPAQDDPLGAYSIIRDPVAPPGQEFPLVRFDGPTGTLSVLRQTSGNARFAVAPGSATVVYLSDLDDADPQRIAIYRSQDGGATWAKVYTYIAGCSAVLVVSNSGADVIASDQCAMPVPVISHDFGATWQPFGVGFFSGAEAYFSHADPSVVYFQAWTGLLRSTDGGATFHPMPMTGYKFDLGFQSTTSWQARDSLYVLSYGNTGIHLQDSRDGGGTWTQHANYPGWISFGIDSQRDGRLYGSSQTPGTYYRSDDAGTTWAPLQIKAGVTSTCTPFPPQLINANPAGPGRTALVPQNAFLILLDVDPSMQVTSPVPISRWVLPLLIALVIGGAVAAPRRRA